MRALFTQLFNCFLLFLASYSAPRGNLIIESIGAMMSRQVLSGALKGKPREAPFIKLLANK